MMKRISTLAIALGLAHLVGAQAAQAACVNPAGWPSNDVSMDGLAFEPASTTPTSVEVDMNGVQGDGGDERNWATHGTLVVLVDATGGPPTLIASWTKNTYKHTDEWVCRTKHEPGTAQAFGDGAFHRTDENGTITTNFAKCSIDLVADC